MVEGRGREGAGSVLHGRCDRCLYSVFGLSKSKLMLPRRELGTLPGIVTEKIV